MRYSLLLGLGIIAMVAYSLMISTYYIKTCLDTPNDLDEWSTTGAPFYITATLNSLTRYSAYYCQNPVYAFSSDRVWLAAFASGANGYYQVYGLCRSVGEGVGLSVDETLAEIHGVRVGNLCVIAPSYDVVVEYKAYYS